jgi:hypothetical protein
VILRDVVIARDLERDQRRPPVLRELALVALGERRLDVVDALDALEAGFDVLDGSGEMSIADLHGAPALDEHLLLGRVAEVCRGDGLVGLLGLAVAVVLVGDRLLADRAREEDRDHDEREPPEDRRLPMTGAPARGARGEVLGFHWGGPPERRRGAGSGRAWC